MSNAPYEQDTKSVDCDVLLLIRKIRALASKSISHLAESEYWAFCDHSKRHFAW